MQHGSQRNSSYQGPRSRRGTQKKRQNHRKVIQIGAGILAGVIILGAAVVLVFSGTKKQTDETQTVESTLDELLPDVPMTINGISVEGMELEEAVSAVTAQYSWKLSVSNADQTEELSNLIEERARTYLSGLCDQTKGGEYTVDLLDVKDLASQAVEDLAAKWDTKPVNSTLDHFDNQTGKFVFTKGTAGKAVDQDALVSAIVQAVQSDDLDQTITATMTETAPEDDATVQSQYKVLATFTTNTTANAKRNTNVKLAAQALNGTIVASGHEFSFNKAVGQRTAEKGYQSAAAYNSGEVVQEIGGGVCQISSTLYRVAFQAAMEISYRRSHTFEPNYVTPGQDATISWDMPDFRFINTSKGAIGIRASYADQKATVSIYGIPVLEDGVTWDLYSEKVEDTAIPDPIYIEDATLAPGTQKVKSSGSAGSTWVTYKVVYKDGKEVERVKDHEKTYKGHAPVILRNSGTTQLKPNETTTATTAATTGAVDGLDDDAAKSTTQQTHAQTQAQTKEPTTAASTTAHTQAAEKAETTPQETTVAATQKETTTVQEQTVPAAPAESETVPENVQED